MKNKIFLALAGLAILPLTAQASLSIRLDDGINTAITVADNAAGDTVSQIGFESVNTAIGNWIVNVTSGTNLTGTASAPSLSLSSINVSWNGTGTALSPLKIFLTDTGYGPTSSGIFDFHVAGTQIIGATIDSSAWYSTSNVAFAETVQLGVTNTHLPFQPSNSIDQTGLTGPTSGLYSLTLETDISGAQSGFSSFQTSSTISAPEAAPSVVPVPAAVWLFGTGLMGLLYTGKRKQMLA